MSERKWWQPNLFVKGLILVLIPLGFAFFFIGVLWILLSQVETEARTIERSRNLILETESLQRQFVEMGTAVAGYTLSKNPMFGSQFSESKSKVLMQVGVLRDLVRDDPQATEVVTKIGNVVQIEVAHLDKMLDEIDSDTARTNQFGTIQTSLVQLSNLFEDVVKRQRNLVRGGPETEKLMRAHVELWIVSGLIVYVVIASALLIFFNAGIARRLKVLTDNSFRLSRQQELLPAPGGHDEISELDKVFRQMAVALADATHRERAIVENAVDVICSVDAGLKFSAVNPASEIQWGYTENDLSGRRLVDIVFDNSDEVTKVFREAIETKRNQSIEIRIRSRTNRPVDTLWTVQWSDAENQLFCVSHDITERKLADQIRRDVVAMVSHDLRSPLSSIMVGVDILRSGAKGEVSGKVEHELEKIGGSASRMVRLINDFLDLEKLQSGKIELKIETTNLDVLVTNSVQAIRALAEMKNISFKEISTDIDLLADGDRVMQVLINLLGNATKFSPDGGTITIKAEVLSNEVEISITDQGPGIEPEQQSAIFENFTQLDIGVLPGSSGLGLSICKNLVELHGGIIGVRSKPGEGSSFWFRLPKASQTV
jgi:PAS domain S-box-containing protein